MSHVPAGPLRPLHVPRLLLRKRGLHRPPLLWPSVPALLSTLSLLASAQEHGRLRWHHEDQLCSQKGALRGPQSPTTGGRCIGDKL